MRTDSPADGKRLARGAHRKSAPLLVVVRDRGTRPSVKRLSEALHEAAVHVHAMGAALCLCVSQHHTNYLEVFAFLFLFLSFFWLRIRFDVQRQVIVVEEGASGAAIPNCSADAATTPPSSCAFCH